MQLFSYSVIQLVGRLEKSPGSFQLRISDFGLRIPCCECEIYGTSSDTETGRIKMKADCGKEVFGYWFLVFGFNQELRTKNQEPIIRFSIEEISAEVLKC